MQFSNIITVLALAMTATALPAADLVDKRTGGGDGGSTSPCSNNQQPTCCNGLLGGILCLVDILGVLGDGGCQGSSYCCDANNAAHGSLISLSLLNCVDL